MNLKYLFLLLVIFSIGFTSASTLCIDRTAPSSVTLLTSSGDMDNLIISWNESIDFPLCSGIAYYNVYKNGEFFLNTTGTEFIDSINYGTTTYTIFAVDLAMYSSNESFLILEYIEDGSSSTSNSRGGSSSTVWECSEWTECINETQSRECNGKYNKNLEKNETKECFPDFIPSDKSSQLSSNKTNETEKEGIKESSTGFSGFNRITGQAIANAGEFATSTTGAVSIGFIFVLGLGFILIRRKRRK